MFEVSACVCSYWKNVQQTFQDFVQTIQYVSESASICKFRDQLKLKYILLREK